MAITLTAPGAYGASLGPPPIDYEQRMLMIAGAEPKIAEQLNGADDPFSRMVARCVTISAPHIGSELTLEEFANAIKNPESNDLLLTAFQRCNYYFRLYTQMKEQGITWKEE